VQLLDQPAETGVLAARWRPHLAQGAITYPSEAPRPLWYQQDSCTPALASQQVSYWGTVSDM